MTQKEIVLWFFAYYGVCRFFLDFVCRGVFADGLDAVQAAGQSFIGLAHRDDLAVGGFQTVTELAGFVSVNLELRICLSLKSFYGLIFSGGIAVCANAFNTVLCACFCSVYL